ncbi:MAG: transglutaminase family protein [Telmatospirillum sp.]|nr:transglutaminase family protein [Telmatospirillum sp.]
MIYRIHHVTSYGYSEPVLLAHHMAHLMPRPLPWQHCRRTNLRIRPQPTGGERDGTDYFGNAVHFFTLADAHRSLTVETLSRVELLHRPCPEEGDTPPLSVALEALEIGKTAVETAEFRYASPLAAPFAQLTAYAMPSFADARPILAGLRDLMHRIHADFTYDATATTIATPLERVFTERRGVCQDFAHLGIACLRGLGLPARYVSGYLLTRPPPGRERLRGADASHAWLSVFVPGHGWIDFDPTNDTIPDMEHITTAWGRDFDDVSPLKGVMLGGGEQSLKVAVDVEPISD